jgi:hypothetical protein
MSLLTSHLSSITPSPHSPKLINQTILTPHLKLNHPQKHKPVNTKLSTHPITLNKPSHRFHWNLTKLAKSLSKLNKITNKLKSFLLNFHKTHLDNTTDEFCLIKARRGNFAAERI